MDYFSSEFELDALFVDTDPLLSDILHADFTYNSLKEFKSEEDEFPCSWLDGMLNTDPVFPSQNGISDLPEFPMDDISELTESPTDGIPDLPSFQDRLMYEVVPLRSEHSYSTMPPGSCGNSNDDDDDDDDEDNEDDDDENEEEDEINITDILSNNEANTNEYSTTDKHSEEYSNIDEYSNKDECSTKYSNVYSNEYLNKNQCSNTNINLKLKRKAVIKGTNSEKVFITLDRIKSEDTTNYYDGNAYINQVCVMPPTPPSSNGSDRDSPTPNNRLRPIAPAPVAFRQQMPKLSIINTRVLQPPTVFTGMVPVNGLVLLTEEEQKTMVAEGYSLPCRYPLSKQEEKNLKKVRRKIKNKLSAQESRRKKKEYVECLEKKMESINNENSSLRMKLETLENNNKSLLAELRKMKQVVNTKNTGGKMSTTTKAHCVIVK